MRQAVISDRNEMLNVFRSAFNVADNSPGAAERIFSRIDEWRVLEQAGRIVGIVHIEPIHLQIGQAVIVQGDLGHVAIHRDLQGKGLGSEILIDSIEWMAGQSYDLSRLGGLHRFYSRFGYLPFPRRYLEFRCGKKTRAGAGMIEEGLIDLPASELACIRPFNPDTDAQALRQLNQRYRSRVAAVCIEDRKLFTGPYCLVYECDGAILAHVQALEYESEITEFEARIHICAMPYSPQGRQAFQSLLKFINNQAYKQNINRLTARLPFDPQLFELLRQVPMRWQACEFYGGLAGNMLQIINLRSLFQKMLPEFERRLGQSPMRQWSGSIGIECQKGEVCLGVNCGRIGIEPDRKPDFQITVPEPMLLKLVLGLISFRNCNIQQKTLSATSIPVNSLLNELFPEIVTASGDWG